MFDIPSTSKFGYFVVCSDVMLVVPLPASTSAVALAAWCALSNSLVCKLCILRSGANSLQGMSTVTRLL